MGIMHMKQGFSLVELSIVLVILGLLTGGILAGQNLIRAAELRSISKDFESYQTAIITFKDQYFALPGDIPNATSYWGNADTGGIGGECGSPTTDTGSGTETCNGNGDGNINDNVIENYRVWQHLANAGLVEGSYTGIKAAGGNANYHIIAGQNAPRGSLSNSAWSTRYFTDFTNANWYDMPQDYGHIMQFGGDQANSWNEGDILTPEEVWNIDKKMDDGVPGTGLVIVFDWTNCTDSGSATAYSGPYDLDNTATQCSIIFRRPY